MKTLKKMKTCSLLLAGIMLLLFSFTAFAEEDENAAPDAGQMSAEQIQAEKEEALKNPQVMQLARKTAVPKGKIKTVKGHVVYQIKDTKEYLKDCWAKIGKYYYHFDEKGYAWKGQKTYKSYTYYFDKNGRMYVSKLRKKGGKTYYFGKTGAMLKSRWAKIKGNRYYFDENGVMVRNRWIGEFWVNASGKYVASKTKSSQKTATFKAASKKQRLIIIGASRVVQMNEAVSTDKNVLYITKSGEGYGWFVSTALPKLRKYLKKYPSSKVVIQMGNNDLAKTEPSSAFSRYAMQFSALIRKYPKASFYFMDALPSLPLESSRNEKRTEFNELLEKTFPKQYIGGYEYMVGNGFETGFNKNHYSTTTSRVIFNYILSSIR